MGKKSFLGQINLMRRPYPELEINLAEKEVFLKHVSNPGLVKQVRWGFRTIFVVEVQRIPLLLYIIQAIIDNDKSKKFYL